MTSSPPPPPRPPALAALAALEVGVLVLAPVPGPDGGADAFVCELANPEAERLLGRPSAAIVGRRLGGDDLGVPGEELLAAGRAALAGDGPWRREVRVSAGALSAAFALRLAASGDRLVLSVRDTSEGGRTARLAAERERLGRVLLDGAAEGLAVVTPDGGLVDVTPALAELCGRADEPPAHVAELWPEGAAQGAAARLRAVAAGGARDRFEGHLALPGGAELPVEVEAWPLGRGAGAGLRVRPHAPGAGLDALAAASSEAIWLVDATGDAPPRVLRATAAAEALGAAAGRPRQVTGMPVADVVPVPGIAGRCRRALTAGTGQEDRVEVPGVPGPRVHALRIVPAGGSVAVVLRPLGDGARPPGPADEEAVAHEAAELHRVAMAVAGAAELYECFDLVAESVQRLLGGDAAGVVRIDDEDRGTLLATATAAGGGGPARGAGIPLGDDSAVARAARTGAPARVDDEGDGGQVSAMLGARTAVAAPVRVGGRLWGLVAVVGRSGEPLPQRTEEVLQGFTDLVGLAVGNADERAALEAQARTDALTGLPNRRAFEEQLAMEVERATRHGYPLALALLDVDHFKQVNDTLGHAVGDLVLTEIAQRLGRLSRGGEMVARIGGEEFAWVLPGAGVQDAVRAVERATRLIAEEPVGQAGKLTLSAGVSALGEGGDAQRLLDTADRALYLAKSRGRNLTVPLTPGNGP